MTTKKIDWRIVVTAIVALVALECYALSQGFNGTMMKVIVAIVAGLAGWVIPSPTVK